MYSIQCHSVQSFMQTTKDSYMYRNKCEFFYVIRLESFQLKSNFDTLINYSMIFIVFDNILAVQALYYCITKINL